MRPPPGRRDRSAPQTGGVTTVEEFDPGARLHAGPAAPLLVGGQPLRVLRAQPGRGAGRWRGWRDGVPRRSAGRDRARRAAALVRAGGAPAGPLAAPGRPTSPSSSRPATAPSPSTAAWPASAPGRPGWSWWTTGRGIRRRWRRSAARHGAELIARPVNGGPAAARNTGLAAVAHAAGRVRRLRLPAAGRLAGRPAAGPRGRHRRRRPADLRRRRPRRAGPVRGRLRAAGPRRDREPGSARRPGRLPAGGRAAVPAGRARRRLRRDDAGRRGRRPGLAGRRGRPPGPVRAAGGRRARDQAGVRPLVRAAVRVRPQRRRARRPAPGPARPGRDQPVVGAGAALPGRAAGRCGPPPARR